MGKGSTGTKARRPACARPLARKGFTSLYLKPPRQLSALQVYKRLQVTAVTVTGAPLFLTGISPVGHPDRAG